MNFLKSLFGGGGRDEDRGLYFYVQPKMCKEILRIRVDPLNDLRPMMARVIGAARWRARPAVLFRRNWNSTSTRTSAIRSELVSEAEWERGN